MTPPFRNVTHLVEMVRRVRLSMYSDPVPTSQVHTMLGVVGDTLENLGHEHDSLLRGRIPTHRCKVCSALWIEYGDSWSLFSRRGGDCCDNAPMGDQIEALPALDVSRPAAAGLATGSTDQPAPTPIIPVPMLLWCPECGERHIDSGEFVTKVHHTHACQACGMVWRPAVIPTVGVRWLPGYKDRGAL